MSRNGINNQADCRRINAVSREFCPFCHGAGNDRRRRCTEHSLENEESKEAYAVGKNLGVVAPCEKVDAAENGRLCAEHDSEADKPVKRRADRKIHKVFHDDITGVF